MYQKFLFVLFACTLVFLGQSCFFDKGKDIPDVSNIKVNVEIKDFHQRLFSIDTNDIKNGIDALHKDFPAFSDVYFMNVRPFRRTPVLDEPFYNNVKSYLSSPDIRKLADTTAIVFSDFSKYQKELNQAFQFYKHYFPEKNIPIIYPFISSFNYSAFIFSIDEQQDGIGIGLDMLLGKDYPYWKMGIRNPAFSNYITRSWTPEHLTKKTLDPLIEDMVAIPESDRLLDLIIYNGKKLYLSDILLPYTPDSIKWEYSTPQTEWVINNERHMWSHFLTEKLLYETNISKTKKLVDQSPSSPGMPPESPGRTGNYMGLRIIQAFMEKNPDVTVQQMIDMDAQKIFDKSKYKPRIRK